MSVIWDICEFAKIQKSINQILWSKSNVHRYNTKLFSVMFISKNVTIHKVTYTLLTHTNEFTITDSVRSIGMSGGSLTQFFIVLANIYTDRKSAVKGKWNFYAYFFSIRWNRVIQLQIFVLEVGQTFEIGIICTNLCNHIYLFSFQF